MAIDTINPGVFFTLAAAVALLAFAGTVGRSYHDRLQREALETAAPRAANDWPPLRVIRGGRAPAAVAPARASHRQAAEALPRAA